MSEQEIADEPLSISPSALREHNVVFAGGGGMGALARATDWSKTRLGAVASWPQSLRTATSIALGSRFPMMLAWGPDFTQLYNDTFRPILGVTKHPALGLSARDTYPEAWHIVGPLFDQVMQGHSVGFEDMLVPLDRNGFLEECFFTYSYSPVRDESGAVGGLLVTVTETTARVVAERRLQMLRELAVRTAGAMTEPETWQSAASVLATNRADLPFAQIYLCEPDGVTAVLASGSHAPGPAIISIADQAQDDAWPLAQALHARKAVLVPDVRARFGDHGSASWPHATEAALVLPITHAGLEAPYGVLVAGLSSGRALDEKYRDFLDLVVDQLATSIGHVRAYQAERQRSDALLELDRQKTEFFSNVSHELRTPLTLLLGPLADVVESAPLPRETLAALKLAQRNGLRLLRMINALLDFTRIQAGHASASYAEVDLAAFTADLCSVFRSAFERAGLSFRVDTPPLGEPIYVDPGMWETVVLNLLSNAFKHTFAGAVDVALRLEPEAAVLTVRDTGVGIPELERPRLFERFHRVRNARSRSHEGSGIGLSMVRELTRLHGGDVEVQSREGEGSLFTVRVPRGRAHVSSPVAVGMLALSPAASAWNEVAERWLSAPAGVEAEANALTDTANAADSSPPGDACVLVVDDNADMREYLRRLLGARYRVRTAADGVTGLSEIRHAAPDVVLCDVMMPEVSGFELVRRLRNDPSTHGVPVILLSARAGDEATEGGLASGADDYLVKPFSSRELLARVATQVAVGRARRAEQRARSRLDALFSQAPVAVSVVRGPDFVFELANVRYERMVGRTALVGKRFRDVFHDLPDEAPVFAMLQEVYATGEPFTASEYCVRLDRKGDDSYEDVYFLFTCQPIHEADGTIDTIITVAVDVTELVIARKAIEGMAAREEAARRLAEQAGRAKDEFLNTLSHELRTPLGAVIGWSSLLREGAVPVAKQAHAFATIERNARAQSRLIEDMLDISRIVQGKLTLEVAPIELSKLVESALDALRPAADAKGIRLQSVLASHATIMGDVDRLQQIIWNLLSNAIKFTPRGGRVQVTLSNADSHVEIAVADSGIGIEASFLPFVFERFRQADASSTRRSGGLGLGLAIVRSLVELHGGTVTAESSGPGEGTIFKVRVPTAPLRSSSPPSESGGIQPVAWNDQGFERPRALHGSRVLVVDDESDARELLAYVLTGCGAHTDTASSVSEALAKLSHERFDVLVSDIGMPAEDGLSLIRKLRALPAAEGGRIPALALTAYARAEDRKSALRAGFNMHLAKPIEPAEFALVVAALLDRPSES